MRNMKICFHPSPNQW